MARNLVSVFLFVFVFVFVFVDGGDEQKLLIHGALILTPDIHERPTERDRGAPCKLQCSAIRLNGNKAIACVNVRTIPIENYETRKIEQLEIFARTKASFFFTAGWTKKRISVFLQLV